MTIICLIHLKINSRNVLLEQDNRIEETYRNITFRVFQWAIMLIWKVVYLYQNLFTIVSENCSGWLSTAMSRIERFLQFLENWKSTI